MDAVSTTLLSESAERGFAILLLVAGIIVAFWWIRKLDQDAHDREKRRDEDSKNREALNRAECLAREQALAIRLQAVEDRQFSETSEVLRRCANALELNAKAIDKLTDKDTGLHLALIDTKQESR